MADKAWRRGKSGLKAETRRSHGGHMADTRRTHGGQAPGTRPNHIAASLFFLRENPAVHCLGKKQPAKQPRVIAAAFRQVIDRGEALDDIVAC